MDRRIEELALEVAERVRAAVLPALGTRDARARVGRAPGGDATLAIDELAEVAVEEALRAAGDIGYYSEDRGLVRIGTPRAVLVIDPVDGTRPAAAGLEAGCVSIGVVPPSEEATLGDVSFGVVQELRSGHRFVARRGVGAVAETADGTPVVLVPSANTDLTALFWTAGQRARPLMATSVVLEELVDGSSLGGGYFDLGSAAFALTRVATGQLDAYVDVGRRIVDEVPVTEAAFRRVGDGAICTNFPYDVAAGALVVRGGGRRGDPRRRRMPRRPPGGRLGARARPGRAGRGEPRAARAPARRARAGHRPPPGGRGRGQDARGRTAEV
ncbi:MAG: hypothetical protein M5U14_07145 [Acidimicrobiia bacterium]|nr:hypothetical protein [Acidimicrobiia bacterium]